MGIASMRQDLATAVNSVPDVTGHPKQPSSPNVGDAWPRLGPMVHDQRSGQFEANWQLLVVLPSDDVAASTWIDDHAWQLVDAVAEFGYVDRMQPALLPAGDVGNLNVLEIQLRGEM